MELLEKVLYHLVKPMVDDERSLDVKQMPGLNDDEVILYVYASKEDLSKLIGKQGVMASSLRSLMSLVVDSREKKVIIKFEAI